jgi:phage terminase large subunit-like protein
MPAPRWSADWINALPQAERKALLASLDAEEAAALLNGGWEVWARASQRPPAGNWRIWLYLGGRGAGKTRAGAEWIAAGVQSGRMNRIGLIGATWRDARSVMVEGESGLRAVMPGLEFERSKHQLTWPGGATATLLSAEQPDALRGHQFDAVWGDEFAKWRNPQTALDMALMAMRLGDDPRMLLTTTPRNIAALKMLLDAPDVTVTHSTTGENDALPAGFHEAMQARYGRSRLGRQELGGELIADVQGALWKRDWIEVRRVQTAPDCDRVVVAVDPPASSTGDECGIVVAGRCGDHGFVLADYSAGGLTPAGWASEVMLAFHAFSADVIIAEANQGGEMVKSVLRQADGDAPVKLVHARRGKIIRAEPVAALYEAGRIHHAGLFAELEDQLCTYAGTGGKSPDRMDALVWALSELFEGKRANPRIRKL